MGKMISDLLDYTRTRLGAGMPLDRVPADLGDIARDLVEEFRAAHPTSTIRLDAAGDLAGDWDADRLRQVISNLLGNAIQHGDPAAPIALTSRGHAGGAGSDGSGGSSGGGSGGGVSFAIRNQGTPIPPGEIAKIFDPLVRGAASTVPRHNRPGSIGLGLYIARELIHAHDGTISVTSTKEAGTTFTFRIPRHVHPTDLHPGAALTPT